MVFVSKPRDFSKFDGKAEWKTFQVLHLLHSEFGGYKWYIKADGDTVVRVERLRSLLTSYSSNEWFYVGEPARYHGNLGTYLNPEAQRYVELTYAQGSMYAISESALHAMGDSFAKNSKCRDFALFEDKGLSMCIQFHLGIGVTAWVGSRYAEFKNIHLNDREGMACIHHVDIDAITPLTRLLYPEASPPSVSKQGAVGHIMFLPLCTTSSFKRVHTGYCGSVQQHAYLDNNLKKSEKEARIEPLSITQDQSMCIYTATPCGIQDGSTSRTKCVRAGCCYDRSRPMRCFSKHSPAVRTGKALGRCLNNTYAYHEDGKCGDNFTTQMQCENMDCCFNVNQVGGHRCYKRGERRLATQFSEQFLVDELIKDIVGDSYAYPATPRVHHVELCWARNRQGHVTYTVASNDTSRASSGAGSCSNESWQTPVVKHNQVIINLRGYEQLFFIANRDLVNNPDSMYVIELHYHRELLDRIGPLPAADFIMEVFYNQGFLIDINNLSTKSQGSTGDVLRQTLDRLDTCILTLTKNNIRR